MCINPLRTNFVLFTPRTCLQSVCYPTNTSRDRTHMTHTEVPSPGSHYNKDVQANMSIGLNVFVHVASKHNFKDES